MKGSKEFTAAVTRIFQHWDVLYHAVQSQFGGSYSKEKAEWLPMAVVEYFTQNSDLESSEVETFIGEIMDNEFDLLVEDGSLKSLAQQLCRCFGLARDERFEELDDFLETLQPLSTAPASIQRMESDEESEEDDQEESKKGNESEKMDVDGESGKNSVRRLPVVDDDGWTVVTKKKQ